MYDALPKRLATLRRSKAMSQEELARILGVSRQAVSKWERGESSPDTLNLIGLADLYEMSLDELVRGESIQSQAPQSITDKALTPASETATNTCNPQNSEGFESLETVAEDVQKSEPVIVETATDNVVKVEVVTTTIPLEAATSFMTKTGSTAEQKAEQETSTSQELEPQQKSELKAEPQAQDQLEQKSDQAATSANVFTASQATPQTASQAVSQTPRPQTPGSDYSGLPRDSHAYPPPTDTAYELPMTPPPPAPLPHTHLPYTPPQPSAPGHYQAGSQGPVVQHHHHKQREAKGALMSFPYPMLCVILYLALGFLFHAWHPGWIIFFTVPIYYWIAEIVEKDPIYQLRKQQREALIRSQINLIEQGCASPTSDSSNEHPPTY